MTHLDQHFKTRPVLVLHSNGHLLNVNSRILEMAGIDASTNIYGVLKDDAGKPTGELMEMAAKYMAYRQTGNPFFGGIRTPSLLSYAKSAVNCGVTTATDLYATFNDESLAAYEEASLTPGYALRLMPAMNTIEQPIEEGLALMRQAMAMNNDRLHHRLCKVMTDGSIQGFTARLKWPGYFNGRPNGLWNMEPAQLAELIMRYHEAGMHLHIHTNGDEASELMLDAIEAAQEAHYRPDHRHTLQHCQMADASQFRRMRKLGVCANLFANHVHYWGDQHAAITMGPDRARRMDACATALREDVALAIHSDAPVTPMAPLFTAWCAVNRLTESGAVLGPDERISVEAAMHAVTLGAAYTLAHGPSCRQHRAWQICRFRHSSRLATRRRARGNPRHRSCRHHFRRHLPRRGETAGLIAQTEMDQQITFTVIGGFLGAGKTSFVNRLLANTDEIRFAILVNDFGALNIDQSLIASQNSQIMQLSNGCICCSLAGGLVDAMVSLMEWRERIDHILIEASGVSYPGRIMDFARIDPELRPGLTLVLVDAASMPSQLNDPRLAEVIAAQMRDADLFLLTKTDIAGDGEVTQTYDYLATHQSQAPVVVARADDPDIIALLLSDDARSHLESRAGDDRRLLLDQSHNDWPHPNFVSAAMSTTAPIEEAAFRSVRP